MNDNDEAKSDADARTLSALLMVVVIATLLMGLIATILPGVLGVVLVVGGLAWFGVLHYLVWGWWFERIYRQGKDEDES